MFDMCWPIMMVVGANCFYHVCAKSVPGDMNAMLSLAVTYLVGAAVAAVLYVAGSGAANFMGEIAKVNWASFVLGIAIVGLEFGSISMYRNGWALNMGSLVCNIILAIALILIGYLLYSETITTQKMIGVALCSIGLIVLNI